VLDQPRVGDHVLVGLVLHARDRLDAAGDDDVVLAGDDALRRGRDRLQPARAEAVDRHPARRDREPRAQRDLPCDVAAGRALGSRAAHDDVVDLGGVELGALDRRLDGVAAERRSVRHVEGAFPALGERSAGGGNDDGGGHGMLLEGR
jgi:hypothetical protein